jgi:hypothetical protein
MRLIGLLSFYDEEPSWLSAAITSYARIGLNHVVVADGAYALLPTGQPRSTTDQHVAIIEACNALGLGLTLHTPQTVWFGNEVEKRAFLFALGNTVAEDDDWFVVIDADEIVTHPVVVRDDLTKTDKDALALTLWEKRVENEHTARLAREYYFPKVSQFPIPKFFRASTRPTVTGNHFTYVSEDGRELWGYNAEPHDHIAALRVHHRKTMRDSERRAVQKAYYKRRDDLAIEATRCVECDALSSTWLPDNWEVIDGQLTSEHSPVCPDHLQVVRERNGQAIRKLGFDPSVIPGLKQGEQWV